MKAVVAAFAPIRQNRDLIEQQSIRKTYKYKLKPTPEQERVLDRTLMLCRHLYNAAIGERREAWRMCGACVAHVWRMCGACVAHAWRHRHLLPAEDRVARYQGGSA
jgi:hypothetical protein